MIKLKIISDGTPSGTKVIDAVTGENLDGVKAVSWRIGVDRALAECNLELCHVPAEVVGYAAPDDTPPKTEEPRLYAVKNHMTEEVRFFAFENRAEAFVNIWGEEGWIRFEEGDLK